jgi:hypothetical protein
MNMPSDRPLLSGLSCLALLAALIGPGCSSDATSASDASASSKNDSSTDGAAVSDGAATASDGGATDGMARLDSSPSATCENQTWPLPTTQLTIDGVSYYLVLKTLLPDAGAYRVQLNFGTAAQFRKCPDEPGQNSTLALTMSFKQKPTASGAFTYTSDRGPATATDVNFYLTFFNNSGHARMNKSYKSPDGGQLNVTIASAKLSATITNLVMTNEVTATDSFMLTGAFMVDW